MAGSVEFIITIVVEGTKVRDIAHFQVPDGAVPAAPLDIAMSLITIAEEAIWKENELLEEATKAHMKTHEEVTDA